MALYHLHLPFNPEFFEHSTTLEANYSTRLTTRLTAGLTAGLTARYTTELKQS
jgi:hypothetical protein